MSVQLAEKIRTHYGDLPRLKSSFSATALGMFSNGWVWFVTDTRGELGVLPTFGPSTLLIRSRDNMNYTKSLILGENDVEVPTPSSLPGTPPYAPLTKAPPPSNMMPSSLDIGSGSLPTSPPLHHSLRPSQDVNEDASSETADRLQNVGDIIYPLFCIPVYEHAWMSAGFGVWGKEDWLKEFWTVLDWGKVSKAFEYALTKHVQL
jgi:superoxide dismutase, Fe-Mn family